MDTVQIPLIATPIPPGTATTPSSPTGRFRRASVSNTHSLAALPKTHHASNPPPGLSGPLHNPLSLHMTTTNFRHFVAKCGPLFWFSDRVEEILTWKAGWKVTTTWMALYAFFCYYPRMVLLIPSIVLVATILVRESHPVHHHTSSIESGHDASRSSSEGNVHWLANMQGIQNFMGFAVDLHDLIAPHAARLCHTPNAHNRVAIPVTIFSILLALVVLLLPFLPIRTIFFLFGLTPLINHPFVRSSITAHHPFLEAQFKAWCARVEQWLDDDSLSDVQLGKTLWGYSSM